MKTNFKVGQKAYFAHVGHRESLEGIILKINHDKRCPIFFELPNGDYQTFTLDGKLDSEDEIPTLSHTPYTVKLEGYSQVEAKELPDLKKDDLIMVSNDDEHWFKRYFSHFNENGILHCFNYGSSSSETKSTSTWKHYELIKNKPEKSLVSNLGLYDELKRP